MKRALVSIGFSLMLGLAGLVAVATPAAAQNAAPARVTLVLTDGTHLVGTVTKQEGDKVYFKSDLLGDMVIEKKDIASVGAAQVPTQAAAGPSATEVNPTATKTAAVKWNSTLNASYAFVSGMAPALNVGNSNSVQLSGFVQRATKKDAIAVIGSYTLQKTAPNPDTANDFQTTVAYNRPLNEKLSFVSRNTVDINKVLQYKYSFTTLDGVAFLPVATKMFKLSVAPGIAYTHTEFENTGAFAAILRSINFNGMGIGAYQTLVVQFNPAMSLTQSQIYIYTPSSGRNQDSGSIALLGMVSPRVGLSIGFNYQYDSILPSPVIQFYRTFTSGIQIKF